jgi:hypothetical protein
MVLRVLGAEESGAGRVAAGSGLSIGNNNRIDHRSQRRPQFLRQLSKAQHRLSRVTRMRQINYFILHLGLNAQRNHAQRMRPLSRGLFPAPLNQLSPRAHSVAQRLRFPPVLPARIESIRL